MSEENKDLLVLLASRDFQGLKVPLVSLASLASRYKLMGGTNL